MGVDEIQDRQVVDFVQNQYGQTLCDFLHSADMCILNGRNSINNDFTCVSSKGKSVLDYCLVSQDLLSHFNNFEVLPAQDLYDHSGCIGVYSSDKAISDHSMIRWELSLEGMCCAELTTDVASDWISSKTTYKLEEISSDFFNSETANGFTETVEDLLASSTLDDVYNQFHSQLFAEMDNELPHFKSNNN